jgi:hypothetical protein
MTSLYLAFIVFFIWFIPKTILANGLPIDHEPVLPEFR